MTSPRAWVGRILLVAVLVATVLFWREALIGVVSMVTALVVLVAAGVIGPRAAVVPLDGGRVRVVRFWKAFRAHKHGKPAPLAAAEAQLEHHLAESRPAVPG